MDIDDYENYAITGPDRDLIIQVIKDLRRKLDGACLRCIWANGEGGCITDHCEDGTADQYDAFPLATYKCSGFKHHQRYAREVELERDRLKSSIVVEMFHEYTSGGRSATTEYLINMPWIPRLGEHILLYEGYEDNEREISCRVDQITNYRTRNHGWVVSVHEKEDYTKLEMERADSLAIDHVRYDLEQGWKLSKHSPWPAVTRAIEEKGLICKQKG